MFETTKLNRRNQRIEKSMGLLYLIMTLLLILPVLLILGLLVYKGAGHLTWEFLTTNPKSGMTAGGIFPALFLLILSGFTLTVRRPVLFDQFRTQSGLFRLEALRHDIPAPVQGLFERYVDRKIHHLRLEEMTVLQ